MDADAIANIAFSKGVEDGLDYINAMDGVDVIYVTKDKEVYASDNIIDGVEITDETFEIVQ